MNRRPGAARGDARVFLRGIASPVYDLRGWRDAQLATPRVRHEDVVVDDSSRPGHAGHSKGSRTRWRIGPGDEPFLTQSLQVHFSELAPGGSNRGHGHQNEAVFYILEGRGYEIHDGRRYDWEKGDVVVVHADSVHRHFNASADERALALVLKAKSIWMLLGLTEQGSGAVPDGERYGPREDFSRVWTPGVEGRRKVLKRSEGAWEVTLDGRVRVLTSGERTDVRVFTVDLYEQEIPPGSRSARHWHMADEVAYVLSGSGWSLHWEVRAEIDDRFYARVAREPSRHEVRAGDLLYVPPNTVHQHFAGDAEPLMLLCAQNRLFKLIGYDAVTYLEEAPGSRGRGTPQEAPSVSKGSVFPDRA